MESLIFNKSENIETNNLIYNIINFNEPKNIFLYGVIIVIGIFISTNITYNYNILIGLIFCSLIIYYQYTYFKYNVLTRKKIDKEKFDNLYSKNQILSKYIDIVDFLFYFENYKSNNIQQYESLVIAFENFVKIYEYCLIDNTLIFKFFSTLNSAKISILVIINSFTFTKQQMSFENIIIIQKIEAEKLLNKYLNTLAILYKKKIYYDGYNNSTKNIELSNILPYNLLFETDYKYGELQYNIANLTSY
jgi:hypothetical protein